VTRRARPPSNDNRADRILPRGEDVELNGAGPFNLPLTVDVELALGDALAVVELATLDGQTVRVPLTLQAIADLHDLTRQVLDAIGPNDGETFQ
jgi:hypothetical protein